MRTRSTRDMRDQIEHARKSFEVSAFEIVAVSLAVNRLDDIQGSQGSGQWMAIGCRAWKHKNGAIDI